MIYIKMFVKLLWKMFRPLFEYFILGVLVFSPAVGLVTSVISIVAITEDQMPFGISPVFSLILSILYGTSLIWLSKGADAWTEIKQSYHDDQRDKISKVMSDQRRQRDAVEAEQSKALQFAASLRKGSSK